MGYDMWFSISVLFEGRHLQNRAEPNIWEESILLVNADCESEAISLARQLALNAEVQYQTAAGDELRWEFREIADIYAIPDAHIQHGTELFSRFLKKEAIQQLLMPFDE